MGAQAEAAKNSENREKEFPRIRGTTRFTRKIISRGEDKIISPSLYTMIQHTTNRVHVTRESLAEVVRAARHKYTANESRTTLDKSDTGGGGEREGEEQARRPSQAPGGSRLPPAPIGRAPRLGPPSPAPSAVGRSLGRGRMIHEAPAPRPLTPHRESRRFAAKR